MDVSIGHLRLVGRVVGATDQAHCAEVVDLLTGASARQRLLEALTSAFDGDEVLVIRSLACSTTLRRDPRGGPDALANSVTSSAAQMLREHPADDDCVVRFADEAAYIAAYVHDYLDGHHHRWYYEAFDPFRRRDGTSDLGALLAAHRALRWRILARVRRNGDLETLISALGDDLAQELATDHAGGEDQNWSPLVITAAEIVAQATNTAMRPVDPPTASTLTETEPTPDWRDTASLGRAVATATAVILASAMRVPGGDLSDLEGRLSAAARQHEWFDHASFAAGLAARRPSDVPAGRTVAAAVEPVLSSRARHVLADLAEVVGDPHLFLDSRRPTSGANLIRLVAALVQAAPQWDDDELARTVVAHSLRSWETSVPQGAGAIPSPMTSPQARTQPRSPAGPAATASLPAGTGHMRTPHGLVTEPSDTPALASDPAAASTRAIAELLDARFPRQDHSEGLRTSSTAAGLLLLRGLLDLGLEPYLLDPVGTEPILSALLRRWSGGPIPMEDPLLVLVADVAEAASGRRERLRDACQLSTRRLLGQRAFSAPLRAVTVPHGTEAIATVVVDGSGRPLPLCTLDGTRGLVEQVSEVAVTLDGEQNDPATRASVIDALASVSSTAGSTGDQQGELLLDLLAASCVLAWARWLPGFATASVPFLLGTVVRRPAKLDVSTTEVTVVLPPRSHDVVLQLAGYLDPIEAGQVLGGRRLRFVTGDQDDA